MFQKENHGGENTCAIVCISDAPCRKKTVQLYKIKIWCFRDSQYIWFWQRGAVGEGCVLHVRGLIQHPEPFTQWFLKLRTYDTGIWVKSGRPARTQPPNWGCAGCYTESQKNRTDVRLGLQLSTQKVQKKTRKSCSNLAHIYWPLLVFVLSSFFFGALCSHKTITNGFHLQICTKIRFKNNACQFFKCNHNQSLIVQHWHAWQSKVKREPEARVTASSPEAWNAKPLPSDKIRHLSTRVTKIKLSD